MVATLFLAQAEGIAVSLVFNAGIFSAIAFIVIMLLNFAACAVLASAVLLTLLTLFSALSK
jgi:hypothetical protein